EFQRAVEPGSFKRLTGHQSVDAVDARPILGPLDQVLLAAVGEDIDQPPYLGFLLFTNRDRLVAPGKDLVAPAGQPGDLAGQLREEVAHEAGKLPAILNAHQEMQVVGEEDEA